ncbi:hypothetical protein F0562_010917 [Nyssa sinensis]|uniref:Uncharacterized protein n=1 Tax=Nyssa sinensis TaxID=561372 RepID=A0A5J5A2R1_9ASTE|nr:hypothetical protein F0562_010917 [Nyssa sinensis]
MDPWMASKERAEFAQVCVNTDIEKPFIQELVVGEDNGSCGLGFKLDGGPIDGVPIGVMMSHYSIPLDVQGTLQVGTTTEPTRPPMQVTSHLNWGSMTSLEVKEITATNTISAKEESFNEEDKVEDDVDDDLMVEDVDENEEEGLKVVEEVWEKLQTSEKKVVEMTLCMDCGGLRILYGGAIFSNLIKILSWSVRAVGR